MRRVGDHTAWIGAHCHGVMHDCLVSTPIVVLSYDVNRLRDGRQVVHTLLLHLSLARQPRSIDLSIGRVFQEG